MQRVPLEILSRKSSLITNEWKTMRRKAKEKKNPVNMNLDLFMCHLFLFYFLLDKLDLTRRKFSFDLFKSIENQSKKKHFDRHSFLESKQCIWINWQRKWSFFFLRVDKKTREFKSDSFLINLHSTLVVLSSDDKLIVTRKTVGNLFRSREKSEKKRKRRGRRGEKSREKPREKHISYTFLFLFSSVKFLVFPLVLRLVLMKRRLNQFVLFSFSVKQKKPKNSIDLTDESVEPNLTE